MEALISIDSISEMQIGSKAVKQSKADKSTYCVCVCIYICMFVYTPHRLMVI